MTEATEQQIHESRLLLKNQYAHLDGDGTYSAEQPNGTAEETTPLIRVDDIRGTNLRNRRASFEEIEKAARAIQNLLWKNRQLIWGDNYPQDPIDALDPEIAVRSLGYEFRRESSLGQIETDSGWSDAAGYIDVRKQYVGISNIFPVPTQNFTAAHELGHAVLHEATGLHRDRAMDGSGSSGARERVEVEADKFATYFLMPEKQVRREFHLRFRCARFVISSETAFALISDTTDALKKKYKNRRELARALATTGRYLGTPIVPLAERFSVSKETMAIRLKELKLL